MYILHLQNVPDSADETIIRRYFKDLKISDGGVQIVDSINGDVLLNFDDEADLLQALTFGETPIHGCRIKILLAQEVERDEIVAKALKPVRLSSKRSKSSKSSDPPDPSTSVQAPPWRANKAATGNDPESEYAASACTSSPAANDGETGAQRDWRAELEAKLQGATTRQPQLVTDIVDNAQRGWSAEQQTKLQGPTTQQPQLASDIVRNALLKLNQGQPAAAPDMPGFAQPQTSRSFEEPQYSTQYAGHYLQGGAEFNTMPPYTATPQWGSQAPQPPSSSMPDPTAEMLKNILRSTAALAPPTHVGAPYNPPVQAPQLSGSAGLAYRPRMPPGPQWGNRPRGPPPGPPPNHWPNTRFPPPGIRPPFRPRGPRIRPPVSFSVGPPPKAAAVPVPNTVPPVEPVPTTVPPVVPVPTTVPLAVPSSGTFQALWSAQKKSRWGGMAVGSSVPPAATVSTSLPSGTKPLIVQGNKAQNSAKVSGNTAMSVKQKVSAVNPALKRGPTPAQPSKSKTSNANFRTTGGPIVIIDSDSDSESESKQKKRKRSRSRSRSRGRSRSLSRGRVRSRSRGKEGSKSSGRRRSRSKSRSRSRSRSRHSNTRDRSKSRERDRGRERERQKPRNYDQDRIRKSGFGDAKTRKPGFGDAKTRKPGPVDTRIRKPGPRDAEPKFLELPQNKPVSLKMFISDPNSVVVHNVAETVTVMVFRDFFYGHPIVKDGIVLKPSDTIPNTQTGYIKFVHERDVEEVKQLSFTTLDGRKLLIKSCCEEEHDQTVTMSEAIMKVEPKPEGDHWPPPRRGIAHRETLPTPSDVLKTPPPKESPFAQLGVSDHITSYHVGIRGFKPGTTACEIWSWFGGPNGHVKGIMVSHRIRIDDDELAFVMYGSKALRNTFRCKRQGQELVWHNYSEKAVIHKLIGNDVCYLTETTLSGKDREVSKAEIKHLRNFRPEGPTKPPLQKQEEDEPQTESSKPSQNVPQGQNLAEWMELSYLCLQETPKGISACNVWSSMYNGKKGPAEGVILANCKSKTEAEGGRFNIAFVGFRDPNVAQQQIKKRGSGQKYTAEGMMRFLARLPDSGTIFLSTPSGQDHVLNKFERLHLRTTYLPKEELSKSKFLQARPSSSKEFELTEEFGEGMHILHIKDPDIKDVTPSEAWSWYPPETCSTRGAVVLRYPDGKRPITFIAFADNVLRNMAHNSYRSPRGVASRSSWAYSIRQFGIHLLVNGGEVLISTKSGGERSPSEEEKSYCMKVLQSSKTFNSSAVCLALITDPVEHAKAVEKEAAISARAAMDDSDQLFYLILKRIPPKVTACQVWGWFNGSAGTSKSAVVVYDANGIAASAYVGFKRESDRDYERPKQKFSKVCTYRSRGVRIVGQMTGCKSTESTTTGVDRVLSEFDLEVMRWKISKIDNAAQEDGETTSAGPTQLEKNFKERSWTQVEKKAQPYESAPSDPPHQGQRDWNAQGKSMSTVAPNNQSTSVQVQGKQQPQHSSSQEKDTFKSPYSSAPQIKQLKTVTPNEPSTWVKEKQPQHTSSQGKGVKTITPYEQSPWVQVEQKPQVLPQPQYSSLEAWQKLSYLCLYETPKGNTASQVWSWFGAEMEKVQCVILAHCTSQNELQDGRFHLAFVGFREPCILKKEQDRLGQSKWYEPAEAMRFLARLPRDTPIFRALTYGHDRLLSKKVRTELEENYLTKEEFVEKQHSEVKPENILASIPNPEDFTLSEGNVRGMLFVQHRVLPKTCTASMVWAWHQLHSDKSKGVVLLKEADGTPHSAFVAYEDAKARAEALTKEQFTSKASWTCVVRRVSVLADRGFQVLMSTALAKDRAPTEAEKSYMLHIRSTNTTAVSSDPMSIDTEPSKVPSTAATITIAASSQQATAPMKEFDVAAAAAEDKSDVLFYLRIRKLPEKVTACQVWSWFQGSAGNSQGAVVVYGANQVPVCAYVGFQTEMHRDTGVTNQRFSKACTYHSRSVFLIDLNPSFKVTESTATGIDRDFTADDFAVIRHKLQQNAVEKKKQKDGNTNPGPSCQQQLTQNPQPTRMDVSQSHGQSNLIESYSTRAQQSVSTQVRQSHGQSNLIESYSTRAQQSVSTQDRQSQMDIDKPVQHTQMEIDKPSQQTPMDIDKPVQQAKMEIDEPVQQIDMQKLLESVQNLHEHDNTIYFRLVKLRPNITAGEIWSWFRGSRGPTRSATLVREFDGTALFAYVGFVSDHSAYLENLELGTFSLCGPKARNIELASLHPSAQVVQSSKQGDRPVLPATMSLFRAGILGDANPGTGT